MSERQTVESEVALVTDPEQRAAIEAENALLQFDAVLDLIDASVRDGRTFRLRTSTVLTLHGIAMKGVHRQAGTFRSGPVSIEGSGHQPPPEHLVAVRVDDLCDWVNDNWSALSAIDLCSYVMWRLNWIHPFADGNGRTTRALAYLILCIRSGVRLPGAPTIPEQIAEDKTPYYNALEVADQSLDKEAPDLTAMSTLLRSYLEKQLTGVFMAATDPGHGKSPDRKFH
jgi:Fic family protein